MPTALSVPYPLTAEAERALAIRLPSQRSDVQILFALAIFLSAFLLFQVELLLGKQILPIFGGAPAVWTTCLLVFQLLLLGGYTFAHGIAVRLTLREQTLFNCHYSVCLCAWSASRAAFGQRGSC